MTISVQGQVHPATSGMRIPCARDNAAEANYVTPFLVEGRWNGGDGGGGDVAAGSKEAIRGEVGVGVDRKEVSGGGKEDVGGGRKEKGAASKDDAEDEKEEESRKSSISSNGEATPRRGHGHRQEGVRVVNGERVAFFTGRGEKLLRARL